ncbi:MAG: anti-sigma factor [Mycobacteriales bacterium]|nr:anti-sigma factor [Mycobacteriales bacterium]
MSTPDLHQRFDELAVGHALGALEPGDEQDFLRHAASCARCDRAVLAHLETLGHLAYASDPATPPASLWDAVRAGVDASDRAVSWPGDAVVPPAGTDELAAARTRRDGRRDSRSVLKRVAAASSVAAGFVLVASLVVQNVSLREQQQDQLALTQSMEKVLSTYDGAGVRRVLLTAEGEEQPAAVAVVDGARLHLVVDSLKPNDARATTYVLWERTVAGDVRAVGTFDVTGDHDVEVVADLVLPDAEQLKALMVTHEQGRKAPASSTQRAVVAGTLA